MTARIGLCLSIIVLGAAACSERSNPSSALASKPGAVDRVNKLIRGELSAVETYRQAIEKQGSPAGELDALRAEHSDAVTQLQTRVRQLGGTASTEAGVWGEFAKAVEGTAKVFGNEAAISALKTGELHGVTEYEDAVADASLDAESKSLIRDTLLPRQRGHAERLDRAKP